MDRVEAAQDDPKGSRGVKQPVHELDEMDTREHAPRTNGCVRPTVGHCTWNLHPREAAGCERVEGVEELR